MYDLKMYLLKFYKGSIQLKDFHLIGYTDGVKLLDTYIKTNDYELIERRKLDSKK